jgi:hypothetical protein
MDWREKFENLRKKHAQVVKEKQRPLPAPTPVTTLQPEPMNQADLRMKNFKEMLPKLSRNKGIIPNFITQTKIFTPTQKGRRKFFKEWQSIQSYNTNIEILQRGEQLNQLDLTGWLMLIKFANHKDMIAAFTRYEFLKAMRKSDSSRDYKWLRSFLNRISFTQFSIKMYENNRWIKYTGSLASEDLESDDGKHIVKLSKPLAALLGFDNWSLINLEQRLALKQREWAQAFHAYLSTNTCTKNGLWWKKEILWKTWGSEYQDQKNFLKLFKRRVIKPLYEIGFLTKIDEKKSAIGLWWKK